MITIPVKVIYQGGYIPDLALVSDGAQKGWLVYKHPDGQWVTLVDFKKLIPGFSQDVISKREFIHVLETVNQQLNYHQTKSCMEFVNEQLAKARGE